MIPNNLIIVIFVILPSLTFGQFTYLSDQSIEVQDQDGNVLALPWTGGLNAAQFNTMDLNGDNVEDLVIFDRMADQVLTFLRIDNTYQYAPEYESIFPNEVTRFLLLRDFNCDGEKDIFTGHNSGVTVLVNSTDDDGVISWNQYYSFAGSSKIDHVLTQGFSGKTNLQLQYDDLPAIVDIDDDGDLDIMNVRFTGNGSIEFHRNLSIEKYNSCDSLDFERVTQTWGGVTQCRCEDFVFNNADCSTSGGRVKHGGGKALLVLDLNSDGEKDVLFSEAECPNIFSLINHGTVDSPVITEANFFPATSQVQINIFPAAFYEDVDFDGINDIITTPNNFQRDFIDQNFTSSTWLYKNTGTNQNPQFAFVKNNFLQESMIDVGDNSVPTFADADGDADLDLFIGYFSNESGFGSIYQYTNIGTASAPKFKLASRDYLNISSLSLYNIKPQFVDINRDQKADLTFIATNGVTNKTSVYYVLNTSETGLAYDIDNIATIDLSLITNENIHFTDINSDGFVDALIGRSTGSLEYWENTRNSQPSFRLNSAGYLGFTPDFFRSNISSYAEDLDGDGKTDLVVADHDGTLGIIEDYKSKGTNGITTELKDILYNPRTDSFDSAKLGGRLWPVVVNLSNSERPSIIAGNILGGVRIINNDNRGEAFDDLILNVYPNPVKGEEPLKIRSNLNLELQIYSTVGSRILSAIPIRANTIETIAFTSLAKGVYIFKFISGERCLIKRVVIH